MKENETNNNTSLFAEQPPEQIVLFEDLLCATTFIDLLLSQLNLASILNLMTVNQELHNLVRSNTKHLTLKLHAFGSDIPYKRLKSVDIRISNQANRFENLNNLLMKMPALTELRLRFRSETSLADSTFIQKLPTQLQSIRLKNVSLDDSFFDAISSLQHLNSLKLHKYTISNDPQSSLSKLTRLTKIILQDYSSKGGNDYDINDALKELTQLTSFQLSLNRFTLKKQNLDFLKNLTTLKSLTLQNIYPGDESALIEVGKNIMFLEKVFVAYCDKISKIFFPATIKSISLKGSLYNSQLLDQDISEKFSKLKELYLSNITLNTEEFSLENFRNLRKIRLVHIQKIKTTEIKLENFNQLNSLEIKLINFKRLSIESCPNLKKIKINQVLLSRLNIEESPSLVSLQLIDTKLEEVPLHPWPNLKKIEIKNKDIEQIIDLQQYSKLESLTFFNNRIETLSLAFHPNLKEVNINIKNLKNIDLMQNYHLESLILDSLKIERLSLESYPNLMKVEIKTCPLLKHISLMNNHHLNSLILKENPIEILQIEACENLKHITISASHLETLVFKTVKLKSLELDCEKLETLALELHTNPPINTRSVKTSASNKLTKISFKTPNLKMDFINQFIAKAKKLQYFSLIEHDQINLLEFQHDQKKLKSIKIRNCKNIEKIFLPDSAKKTLEILDLDKFNLWTKKNFQHTIESFCQLTALTELKALGCKNKKHINNYNIFWGKNPDANKKPNRSLITFKNCNQSEDWVLIEKIDLLTNQENPKKQNTAFFAPPDKLSKTLTMLCQYPSIKSPTGDEQEIAKCYEGIALLIPEGSIEKCKREQITEVKQICFKTLLKISKEKNVRKPIINFLNALQDITSEEATQQTILFSNTIDSLQTSLEYRAIYRYFTDIIFRTTSSSFMALFFEKISAIFKDSSLTGELKIHSILKNCISTTFEIDRGMGSRKSDRLTLIQSFMEKIIDSVEKIGQTTFTDPKSALLYSEAFKKIIFHGKNSYRDIGNAVNTVLNQETEEGLTDALHSLKDACDQISQNLPNKEKSLLTDFIAEIDSTQEKLKIKIHFF